MIPAILAAWKAAATGKRIASIVAPIVLVVSLMGWAYHKGKAACERAHTVEMVTQALDVADHTIAKAEQLDQTAARHSRRTAQREQDRDALQREVTNYAQRPKTTCDLDTEYIALLERLVELHPGPEGGVLEADPGAAGADELQAARVTTTELLRAFQALSAARARDVEALTYWREWETARYASEMEWYQGLPPESRGADE